MNGVVTLALKAFLPFLFVVFLLLCFSSRPFFRRVSFCWHLLWFFHLLRHVMGPVSPFLGSPIVAGVVVFVLNIIIVFMIIIFTTTKRQHHQRQHYHCYHRLSSYTQQLPPTRSPWAWPCNNPSTNTKHSPPSQRPSPTMRTAVIAPPSRSSSTIATACAGCAEPAGMRRRTSGTVCRGRRIACE